MSSHTYRGRLAPSPTGLLHLGHARTFWIAGERVAGGTLVLRNEDLDPHRARPAFAAAMLEDLHWLGLRWQEGPDLHGNAAGEYGPYAQSERREHYLAAWRTLVERGFVYPCRCSRRELQQATRSAQRANDAHEDDDEPLYPGTCRPSDADRSPATENPAGVNWRFRVPDGETIAFADGHAGPRSYVCGRDFGDFLVWRRDDVPAYQLAVVVDDAAMRITEVVRGADLLKSTARQLLLYRALGFAAPAWFHCPLVRDAQGQRLAKRADSVSLRTLREQGMTPGDVLALAASL